MRTALFRKDFFEGANCRTAARSLSARETQGAFSVFDLSGNVYEWENACDDGVDAVSAPCRIRAGSFFQNLDTGSCGAGTAYTLHRRQRNYDYAVVRNTTTESVGFRRCSAVD